MNKLQQYLLPATRYRLDNPRWWAQQNFLLGSRLPESRLLEGNNNFVEKSKIKLYHQKKYQTAVTKMPT